MEYQEACVKYQEAVVEYHEAFVEYHEAFEAFCGIPRAFINHKSIIN